MQLVIQMAEGAAWLAVLAGLLLLAYRSGKLPGGLLVASMIAMVAWSLWGLTAAAWLGSLVPDPAAAAYDAAGGPGNAASVLLAMGRTEAVGQVCQALIVLWFGVAFLLAVSSVRRPNR
jgi:hypothetical protein